MTLWRVENGRIKEEWSEFDQADILRQIGLAPKCDGTASR
jgi:predicted ester cyclase